MKYACIARHLGEYPVRLMCRVLGVSPAGFYAAEQHRQGRRRPSARTQANAHLLVAIRGAHTKSDGCYGAPTIAAELTATGIPCGRHRVARLMRHHGLRGLTPRAFRVTTQSDHRSPVAANLLARRFAPSDYLERDRVWVADLTYIATREGWLYLAVILDLASRRVLGWCADHVLDHSLALRALDRALALRQPRRGLIHHSDRGVQYTSAGYQRCLAAHGIQPSMSRVGNCWDNAVAESFFATLKRELVARYRWHTRDAVQAALRRWIDMWYNHQRRHSTLGFLSPVAYERKLMQLRSA